MIEEVLKERGSRYGDFKDVAEISNGIKNLIKNRLEERKLKLTPYQLEGIDMIANKLARIANGDPYYQDNWVDIAGYSKLVADALTVDERMLLNGGAIK